MNNLTLLSGKLGLGLDLSPSDLESAVEELTSSEIADRPKETFLLALATKGETAEEVAGFAAALRRLSIDPQVGEWSPRALDIVGTGGDHAGGFNVSSLVTLVLAAAGIPVMKHGNRGITSRCGSADLFAGLGYQLDAPPEKIRAGLAELGYAFFFAPAWHPAFKQVAAVRKHLAAQGQRTIFNILGPLLNPGRPAHVLLGAASVPLVEKLASALDASGVAAGLAAHGILGEGKGIDELTSATPNRVRGAGRVRELDATWSAEDFGLTTAPFSDLLGGDLADNLALTQRLLEGTAPRGLEDTIVLNAAVAFWLTGRTSAVPEGIAEARTLLTGGAVEKKIAQTRAFFRT